MLFLIIVSLLWAFSFGIIGSRLAGVDSNFSAAVRLSIAFLCFLPLFRLKRVNKLDLATLVGIGALQFGVMYISYMRAFVYLPSHLVALFSVFTPLYIAVAYNLMQSRWQWSLLGCAVISIAGAVVIKFSQPSGSFWTGFILMQIANLAFGLGQLLYRSWKRKRPETGDSEVIAALYLGGAILAGIGFAVFGNSDNISPRPDQWYALIYLGAVASGLGFFLWNKGAARTTAGTLAAANNAVVPLAMAASLFFFGEAGATTTDALIKLAIGATLIFAAMAWGQRESKA
ncbi:EamA family transporter [Pelagicoccus mobilis]|uniref:EamA family transporter n=1 Tax=Pelagicoccus mobilis TaxID=415221 RepID=A0A934VLW4_9BACT|nr:EamA family transporter [Pelagicoccus mobilis]MBK1878196.1 EamA family transporter [Pelagicoccus mobilis]